MDRRTRICIWIIFLGLGNFLAYVILYSFFWGEAVNGHVLHDGGQLRYFLQSGEEVSRGVFLYSGLHSISIAPTAGAIMLAMLTLAKDRVISSMRRTIVRGRTVITILAVLITVIALLLTAELVRLFTERLASPRPMNATAPAKKDIVQQGLTLPRCESSFRPSGALCIRMAFPGACAPGYVLSAPPGRRGKCSPCGRQVEPCRWKRCPPPGQPEPCPNTAPASACAKGIRVAEAKGPSWPPVPRVSRFPSPVRATGYGRRATTA